MTKQIKKIIKISLSALFGAGLLSVIIASSVIMSGGNTSNLFAEIVVSDNTSVLADKSFSETTFNGYRDFLKNRGDELKDPVQDYREGFGLWRRPGTNNNERETTFKGIFDNGKDLIIAPGFNHAQAIENVAQDKTFSNKGFLLLDSGIANPVGNVSTVEFRMEQAGFQCGVAASQFLNSNENIFGKDGSLKIGGFVGLAFPSTLDFLIGYQKGMVAWNQANPSAKQIEWIDLGPNVGAYTSGSFGIGDGRQISQNLLIKGADVIMPIAGPQTLDAITEIGLQNRPVVIIGVDSPQEENLGLQKPIPNLGSENIKAFDGTPSDNNNIIQFSAEKKLNIAVQGTLTAISNTEKPNEAEFDGSSYGGFGWRNIIALGPDGSSAVGISKAGEDYFTKGLGGDPSAGGYADVVAGLLTNPVFNEMIGPEGQVSFYNTTDGSGTGEGVASIDKYSNGLNNFKTEYVEEALRLNGTHFAPPPLPKSPIVLNDVQNLKRKES
ncbi:MAG: BMP family ABC transporter substrate-binding protein [Mycoplasmoidaceae bacterium]